MKKIAEIFKNKEILSRIVFTILILLVFRIGAGITLPRVTLNQEMTDAMNSTNALGIMNLLGGGALSNFSIFALGVSPYITSSIIIQLLGMDVLPALSELQKQGQAGRKKTEMATRYLTLLLGAVQAYGLIRLMETSEYVTLQSNDFWTYVYLVTIMLAGGMIVMWLGDQISTKGLGNGISIIIFSGIVVSLPVQISSAFQQWVGAWMGTGGDAELLAGWFKFGLYVIAFLLIIAFIAYIEMSKRKIPVQHAGKSGGSQKMSQASFLPIKINSAGVIPVIFASSLLMAPSIVVSFIGEDTNAEWLKIFDISKTVTMPWFNDATWQMPWGLLIYITLTVAFCFFYAQLQINPAQLAENFQKNGSYIPGIRPGNETEKYVKKVTNRITTIGAISLSLVAAMPVVITLTKVFGENSSLALGGTGLIIVVGVCIEVMSQIDGLLAGKTFEEVVAQGGKR
jgi:preprotein translocase subunit SecY